MAAGKPARMEDLHGNARQHLLPGRPTAGKSLFLAADSGLVDLHLPTQPLSAGTHQCRRKRCNMAHAV